MGFLPCCLYSIRPNNITVLQIANIMEARERCLRRSLLICRPQAGEIVGETAGFSARYTCAMRPIDDIACFKPGCDNCEKRGVNIVGHGWFTTKSGRRRRYRCKIYGGTASMNTGTAYSGLRCTRREFDQVASLRIEGVSISATARVTGHSRNTIRPLARAGLESGRALQPANAAGLRNR